MTLEESVRICCSFCFVFVWRRPSGGSRSEAHLLLIRGIMACSEGSGVWEVASQGRRHWLEVPSAAWVFASPDPCHWAPNVFHRLQQVL